MNSRPSKQVLPIEVIYGLLFFQFKRFPWEFWSCSAAYEKRKERIGSEKGPGKVEENLQEDKTW